MVLSILLPGQLCIPLIPTGPHGCAPLLGLCSGLWIWVVLCFASCSLEPRFSLSKRAFPPGRCPGGVVLPWSTWGAGVTEPMIFILVHDGSSRLFGCGI